MENLPPDVYEWVKKEFDGGNLGSFLQKYNIEYDNLRDFLNGFTIAVIYTKQHQFPEKDWKWLRISISTVLANLLTKNR